MCSLLLLCIVSEACDRSLAKAAVSMPAAGAWPVSREGRRAQVHAQCTQVAAAPAARSRLLMYALIFYVQEITTYLHVCDTLRCGHRAPFTSTTNWSYKAYHNNHQAGVCGKVHSELYK